MVQMIISNTRNSRDMPLSTQKTYTFALVYTTFPQTTANFMFYIYRLFKKFQRVFFLSISILASRFFYCSIFCTIIACRGIISISYRVKGGEIINCQVYSLTYKKDRNVIILPRIYTYMYIFSLKIVNPKAFTAIPKLGCRKFNAVILR